MDEKARYEPMAHGPIGAAVKASMPHTEADPIGVHAAVLALFSAAINGKVTPPTGSPVVVWTALVGPSRIGRKGFALKTAKAILKDSIGEWLSLREEGGISSGPSLVQTIWENEQDSLTSEGGPDSRTLIIDQEWQTTLLLTKRCPKYGGILRTSWDGGRISNVTKKDGKRVEATVEEPALGFHAHIQPPLWAKFISLTEAQGGTYNRILPVMVKKSKRLRKRDYKTGNSLDEIRVSASLRLAYEWAMKEPRRMQFTDASADRFDDMSAEYEDMLEELPDDVSCYIERSDEQVLRVACVLTAAERKTVITVKALEAAKAFVDYSIASVRQLVSQSNVVKSRTVQPLDVKIRAKLETYGGEMTSTQLYRSLSSRYTADQILNTAEDMADVEIEEQRQKRPGANPVVFRLVPVMPEPEPEAEPEPVKVPAQRKAPAKKAAPVRKATAEKAPPAPRRAAKKAAPKKTNQPTPVGT
ncbi:DUF3987 domain-containing protein [Streptomyces afghaniensis]|uniref:DUF3987 domain-containing protein n=1 Tax=Streptomyces afghaniensis TaxID=66865 RepID=UPI0027892DC8|nr:DUF3987 domain-containing protein [Streptomyces afghaniensis]MDQ1016712.1 hypothetical protein [Streptomyces afghaniensis]